MPKAIEDALLGPESARRFGRLNYILFERSADAFVSTVLSGLAAFDALWLDAELNPPRRELPDAMHRRKRSAVVGAKCRGEISGAIVAHIVTNALLAAYVVVFGHWAFW